MKNLARIAGAAAALLAAQGTAFAYSGTANVTFSFGGTVAGAGTEIGWTSQGGAPNLAVASNTTQFISQAGYNSTSYYNTDFASAGDCSVGGAYVPAGSTAVSVRKYGCRYTDPSATAAFTAIGPADAGPGGAASGTLTVTDTTLTGVLTLLSTTDEPTGGGTTSVGNGTNGFNLRTADGSPFGNAWYGATTAATLTVNLTGTFTASSWSINGGAVTFSDAGFLCQQGGNSTPANLLCTTSASAGGFQATGGQMDWGWDLDGRNTGFTTASPIQVRDALGTTVLDTLSGVLASLSIDGSGNITTNQGEYRRAAGNSFSGCGTFVKWDGTKLTCGTLSAGALTVSGTVVPVPAAVWLFGSALGLMGIARRKLAA